MKEKKVPYSNKPLCALKIAGLIPARFESRRFPGKPLALIAGKTLIQRTYENVKKNSCFNLVAVVTDDQRIFRHVEEFGGIAIMTSPNCPTGTERLAEAAAADKRLLEFDVIVNLQGDEPLLEPEVIESVIEKLTEDKDTSVSTAACKIDSEAEALDYSVVKCVFDKKGSALYFSRTLIPNGHFGKWQKDCTYYRHLGIYAYRKEFLLHYQELSPTPLQISEDLEQLKVLEHGFRIKVAEVKSSSIGVDKPEDIKKIERLLVL